MTQPVALSSPPEELRAQVDMALNFIENHNCYVLSGVEFVIWTPHGSMIVCSSSRAGFQKLVVMQPLYIQHCHSLMMVWQQLYAAGGKLAFS